MHALFQSLRIWSDSGHMMQPAHERAMEIAHDVVDLLYEADKDWVRVRQSLRGILLANSWKLHLSWVIFASLREAIEDERPMGSTLQSTYTKMFVATQGIENIANDESMQRAVIALGILVSIIPWKLETLGFTRQGFVKRMGRPVT